MTVNMDDSAIYTVPQLRRFLAAAKGWKFKGLSQADKYAWVESAVRRFNYFELSKKDKAPVREYIMLATGFSRAQMNRLLNRKLYHGSLATPAARRNRFPVTYTCKDIELLAETDNAHGRLSGPATKAIFQRQFEIYSDLDFVRLKDISSAHIYNLRQAPTYKAKSVVIGRTKSVNVAIGERRKPSPDGKPGHLRVDTVHQGDRDGVKGVYNINLVDEVTQWEVVTCVEAISEAWMDCVLENALTLFPFRIKGFHSDNGGEFINGRVAAMLGRQVVAQTKSRSNRTNDNALVEGKNGSVIRKHMGYWHIAGRHAVRVNEFYAGVFTRYLNYHRPCGFADVTVDERGKRTRKYKRYMTPYEALKKVPEAVEYLKEGVTFEQLDKLAAAESDNECAERMQDEKKRLFRKVLDGN